MIIYSTGLRRCLKIKLNVNKIVASHLVNIGKKIKFTGENKVIIALNLHCGNITILRKVYNSDII